ncbi:4-methyl-5(B-hydroxyethyl)-thiazole monophosphate biosynthesis protein [Planctomycetota bacterium]|nr:4-methyl-5(B-hydroxyethyl)-thiazole monophosphate biosynthesis protein [Planctomycetota bacterium]
MPDALVVLAPGAEEIEFATIADLLVRAGVTVTVASAGAEPPAGAPPTVVGSRGIVLGAHRMLDAVLGSTPDLLYLPGGGGSAECCRNDPRIQDLAERQLRSGRWLAAICAAPTALIPRKLCAGRRVTCFPGLRAELEPHAAAWIDAPVVVDGNLVTSQAAGTSMHCALTLVERLVGPGTAARIAAQIHLPATAPAAA